MQPNHSEVYAGLVVLLLILVAAAILLPPWFAAHGREWVVVVGELRGGR